MSADERPTDTLAYVAALTSAAATLASRYPSEFAPPPAQWAWFEANEPLSRGGRAVTRDSLLELAQAWYHDHATDTPPTAVADRIDSLSVVCRAYGNMTLGELSWLLYCVRVPDAAPGTGLWSKALSRLRLMVETRSPADEQA